MRKGEEEEDLGEGRLGEGRRGGWVCGYLQLEGIVGANKIKNKNTLISQRLIIFLQKRKPLPPPRGPPNHQHSIQTNFNSDDFGK